MAQSPRALILSGFGLNCEEETKYAFELAGAWADIWHIQEVIDRPGLLNRYQILVVPGGFSYGDDLGSGMAYAAQLRNHLFEHLHTFVTKDKLVLGICNGFQILTNLGLLPAHNGAYGTVQVALTHNDVPRYTTRWVDVVVTGKSPWLRGLSSLSLPIAHGEGKFFTESATLKQLDAAGQLVLRYHPGEVSTHFALPTNPNGSLANCAGICDPTGRVLGLMPHPERAVFFTQLPHWTLLKEQYSRSGKKIPKYGPGLQLFKNAVGYFR